MRFQLLIQATSGKTDWWDFDDHVLPVQPMASEAGSHRVNEECYFGEKTIKWLMGTVNDA